MVVFSSFPSSFLLFILLLLPPPPPPSPSLSCPFFPSSLLCSPLPFFRSQRSESARWCLCQRAATAGLHPAEDRRASSQRGPAVRHFPNSAGDPPAPPHSPPLRPSTLKALSSFLTVNAANYGPPPSPLIELSYFFLTHGFFCILASILFILHIFVNFCIFYQVTDFLLVYLV